MREYSSTSHGSSSIGGRRTFITCCLVTAAATAIAVVLVVTGASALAHPGGITFTVNSPSDAPDVTRGNGKCETATNNNVCTLRAAIQEANALPGVDTINLGVMTMTLTRIGSDDTALNGDLDITDTVTIVGAGAGLSVIDGSANDRVFHVLSGVTASMSGVTIQNGDHPVVGGGIVNYGTLALTLSEVRSNRADGGGGGITNYGGLLVTDSAINDNRAGINGAGIYNNDSGVTLVRVTLNHNIANNFGGGLYSTNASLLSISRSTFSDNEVTSDGGGAIYHAGSGSVLKIVNSTISGNSAWDDGGNGIYNASGTVSLYNATVASNASGTTYAIGGGIRNISGTVTLRNTILANNTGQGFDPDDCKGTVISEDYNLIETTTGCNVVGAESNNLIGQDPQLGPLQNNGGPTHTRALLPVSPAINRGNPSGCTDSLGALLTMDQRGFRRPVGGRCDIGAYEAWLSVWLPLIAR